MRITRRALGLAAGSALGTTATLPARASAPTERIRIGYTISLSGPFKDGAAVTTLPNYRLWIRDVNAHGGIAVGSGGRRLPIDVIEYDDASSQDNAIRLTAKLIAEDKVDFLLPPWGTGMNLAVAPLYRDHGYPLMASTCVANGLTQMVRKFPTMFFFLAEAVDYVAALVRMLVRVHAAGRINNKIAMLYVGDQFGAELAAAAEIALAEAGFIIAVDRSYAVQTRNLSQELEDARRSGADSLVCFSYPPDSFLATATAQSIDYNPKIFYVGVGTAFPAYKKRFADGANGILGNGGLDMSSADVASYARRHQELTGQEPDRWAGPGAYASLECLEQAITAAGAVDRGKVLAALRGTTFRTVLGPIQLGKQIRGKQVLLGQWQAGEFVAIEPNELPGARELMFPKPAWRR